MILGGVGAGPSSNPYEDSDSFDLGEYSYHLSLARTLLMALKKFHRTQQGKRPRNYIGPEFKKHECLVHAPEERSGKGRHKGK